MWRLGGDRETGLMRISNIFWRVASLSKSWHPTCAPGGMPALKALSNVPQQQVTGVGMHSAGIAKLEAYICTYTSLALV